MMKPRSNHVGDMGQGGRIPLVVPDLTFEGPVKVSLWLVPRGATVGAGDRIVELLAGAATVDLEAPVAGRLARQFVDEDDTVGPGTVLAEIEPVEEA
jgi:pyruvate/2-oxoglutarate dehydrogenase complex dihydrolipoamide acyltransferase (E2) component